MRPRLGLAAATAAWLACLSPALAEDAILSGSRYSAPLWTWVAAIVVAVGLSLVGLLVGWWFLRKRSRIESSD